MPSSSLSILSILIIFKCNDYCKISKVILIKRVRTVDHTYSTCAHKDLRTFSLTEIADVG